MKGQAELSPWRRRALVLVLQLLRVNVYSLRIPALVLVQTKQGAKDITGLGSAPSGKGKGASKGAENKLLSSLRTLVLSIAAQPPPLTTSGEFDFELHDECAGILALGIRVFYPTHEDRATLLHRLLLNFQSNSQYKEGLTPRLLNAFCAELAADAEFVRPFLPIAPAAGSDGGSMAGPMPAFRSGTPCFGGFCLQLLTGQSWSFQGWFYLPLSTLNLI